MATINRPIGGEVLTNGNSLNIPGTSSLLLANTYKITVYYKISNSFMWKLAGTVNGNPGSFNWPIPSVAKNSVAIIKLVFRNNSDSVLGVAVSNPLLLHP